MRDITRRQERVGHRKYLGVTEDRIRRSEEAGMEQMEGDGILDILKSLGRVAGRAASSKVGQEVLGAVLPTLAGSVAGRLGRLINPAQEGEGLMLAGQRGRAMPMKKVMKKKVIVSPEEAMEGMGLMLAGRGVHTKKKGNSQKKKMMMLMNDM
jgi:hypothetical protein